jgi:hypothetical protein
MHATMNRAVMTDDLSIGRPPAAARTQFREQGFVEIDDLWTADLRTAIADEAGELYAAAIVPVDGPRTPVVAAQATGKVTPVARGPLLERLHDALTPLVRQLAGKLLVPSFANYGYFPDDDGTILHLDTDATEIVVLTTALGAVGDLRVHPDLQGSSPDELGQRESDPDWSRYAGQPLRYPALGAAVLRGAAIPHSRPATPVASLSAVAALHYRSPF